MRNLTMLIDLYELTVADSLFRSGKGETVCYFDLIFRQNPDKGGFVIMAGLEQAIEYIENLRFTDDDRISSHKGSERGVFRIPFKSKILMRYMGSSRGYARISERAYCKGQGKGY